MNKYSHSPDEFILQYLDGQVPMKDKTEFENALKLNGELNQRFQQLKMVHDALHAGRLEHPRQDFTARVMRSLDQTQARLIMSPKNGLMLLLGVGIALMLGVAYLYTGTFDQISGVINLNQVRLPQSIIQQSLPAVPFSASMMMKVLVGLNLAIAFVLIDRTILQPYFRNRSARQS